jgi:hypothetical protein
MGLCQRPLYAKDPSAKAMVFSEKQLGCVGLACLGNRGGGGGTPIYEESPGRH